jgi:hypothetical protein
VNHLVKAITCFFLSLALYVGTGTVDESVRPVWLEALLLAVVGTFVLEGVRRILLHFYNEADA